MNQNEKIAQVLRDSASTMRKLAEERDVETKRADEAEAKLASLRTRLEAEKLAAEMHEKGLRSDTDFAELVDDLEKAAHEGRLPVLQEAVKMAAPNMGNNFHIHNDEHQQREGGSTELEQFLVGNVG